MVKIARKTIRYGASNNDVEILQKRLNEEGYKLDVDGIFGEKTQSAVRDYQKKNRLDVDGIVGKNTWAKLYSKKPSTNGSKAPAKPQKPQTPKKPQKTPTKRPIYTKSPQVQSAEKQLEDWENRKPGNYESKYGAEIDKLLNEIVNREDFSYSLGDDPLYQQYRSIYTQNGKKAMMDTIGEATALTGGYANSYAQNVGQQAYDEYLNELNGIALDLRDRAYENYMDKGDKLVGDIKLLRSLDGDDYERYLDNLEKYYNDGDYFLKRLSNMSDADFKKFLAQVDAWEADRKYEFDVSKDKKDREEFEKQMEFKREEARRDQANKDRDYELRKNKVLSSGGRGGRSGSSKKGNDDSEKIVYPRTYEQYVAVTGDGTILTKNEFLLSSAYVGKYGSYIKYLEKKYDQHRRG